MPDIRIDIIHKWNSEPPSLNNLRQGLEAANESFSINIHNPSPINLPGQNKAIAGIELGSLSLQILSKYLTFRGKSDIVIIHKTLEKELIEYIFGMNVSETLFLRCDQVIHTTYDADWVYFPQKTKLLFENSDLVYVTSKEIKDEAEKYTSDDRIRYIPPSVDTDFFTPSSVPEKLHSDSLVLGWVGNADVHQDNLRYLADCLQGVDSETVLLRLLLGGGTLEPETRSRLEEIGVELDTIEFVPWEKVPEVINSFDIGLAPLSDTEFNRGRSSEKIREYMACGVPVIGSDVGENPRLVPEETGILVDETENWEAAIATLSDVETRSEMGENARNHVVENYAIPVIAEEIADAINQLYTRR